MTTYFIIFNSLTKKNSRIRNKKHIRQPDIRLIEVRKMLTHVLLQ